MSDQINEWEPNIEQSIKDRAADIERDAKEHRTFTLHFHGEVGKNLECDVEAGGNPGVVVAPGDSIPVIEFRAFERMRDCVGYLRGVMNGWVNGETEPNMSEVEAEIWKRKRGLK